MLDQPWLSSLYNIATWHDRVAHGALRPFRRIRETRYYLLHVIVYVLIVLFQWTVIWVALWQLAPNLLVDNSHGLDTLLQVVPVAIIGLFVLVLGLALTVGQLVVTSFGSRAIFVLVSDTRIRGLVIRSLLVVFPAVLLAGTVPSSGPPSDALASAVTITAILTLDFMLSAAAQLPGTTHEYTAVRPFVSHVATEAGEHLKRGLRGYVIRVLPVLGDVLKRGVQDEDDEDVAIALAGLRSVRIDFLSPEASRSLAVRRSEPGDGAESPDWFCKPLCRILRDAGRQSQRESPIADAIQNELNATEAAFRKAEGVPAA